MQTLKKLPMVLVTLAAVLALGFGASEAFAENAALACPYEPSARLGECISVRDCDIRCSEQPGYVEGSHGQCEADGCCWCYL